METKGHPILGINVNVFGLMYTYLFLKAKFRRIHNLSNKFQVFVYIISSCILFYETNANGL